MECRFMSKFGESVGWKVIYETAWSEIMENCKKKPNFCIFNSRLLKSLSNLGHMDILIWYEFGEHISPNKKVGFFFAFLTFLDLGWTRGISEFPEKAVLMLPKNYCAFYNHKRSAKKADLRNFLVFMLISQNWPKTATFWKIWGINITLKLVIFLNISVMVVVA